MTLYEQPPDPTRPVVCFDENPVQLMRDTRQPLPAQASCPQRYDYEYNREGTANLFMFFRPLSGWRHVKIMSQRTKRDFAECMLRIWLIHTFPTQR